MVACPSANHDGRTDARWCDSVFCISCVNVSPGRDPAYGLVCGVAGQRNEARTPRCHERRWFLKPSFAPWRLRVESASVCPLSSAAHGQEDEQAGEQRDGARLGHGRVLFSVRPACQLPARIAASAASTASSPLKSPSVHSISEVIPQFAARMPTSVSSTCPSRLASPGMDVGEGILKT